MANDSYSKKEISCALGIRMDMTDKQAKEVVDGLFSLMEEALKEGKGISISGFGAFKLADVAERKGRNPSTGEELTVPAHRAVKFKPAPRLKELVKNG